MQVEYCGIALEVCRGIDEPGKALCLSQDVLVTITQTGCHPRQPVLAPEVIVQTRMILFSPLAERASGGGNDRADSGQFYGYLMRVKNVSPCHQREQVYALCEGYLRHRVYQVGDFQVALVIQQRHLLFEESKVD